MSTQAVGDARKAQARAWFEELRDRIFKRRRGRRPDTPVHEFAIRRIVYARGEILEGLEQDRRGAIDGSVDRAVMRLRIASRDDRDGLVLHPSI